MATFLDLPEDVVVEIMSRLPPESFGQFKCVQKSWNILINDLIKSSWFIAKHLQNSISNKTSSLIFKARLNQNCYPRNREGILTLFNDDDKLGYLAKEVDRSKYSSVGESLNELAYSHCNGILCLVSQGTILLLNPTTTEYKHVPYFNCGNTIRVGFGYDQIDEVYKVVRVTGTFFSTVFGLNDLGAQVYDLGSDSWREIKMTISHDGHNHEYYYNHTTKHVYCKGVYYWLLLDDIIYYGVIQSFKVHEEEFHNIGLPNMLRSCNVDNVDITQWNGSVALFFCPFSSFLGSAEVWVMHESNEGSHCWTKQLSIGQGDTLTFKIPIAFWKNDELLLRQRDQLVSYNIITKKVRSLDFHIKGLTYFRAFNYVKSLVPLTLTTKPTYFANEPWW